MTSWRQAFSLPLNLAQLLRTLSCIIRRVRRLGLPVPADPIFFSDEFGFFALVFPDATLSFGGNTIPLEDNFVEFCAADCGGGVVFGGISGQ
jgi:hypothetical protein